MQLNANLISSGDILQHPQSIKQNSEKVVGRRYLNFDEKTPVSQIISNDNKKRQQSVQEQSQRQLANSKAFHGS